MGSWPLPRVYLASDMDMLITQFDGFEDKGAVMYSVPLL